MKNNYDGWYAVHKVHVVAVLYLSLIYKENKVEKNSWKVLFSISLKQTPGACILSICTFLNPAQLFFKQQNTISFYFIAM